MNNNNRLLCVILLGSIAIRTKPEFYTIPGKKFDKSMTLDHTGYHLPL